MDTHEINNIPIHSLQITDVPWHRLTTPYGRGTKIHISDALLELVQELRKF
ncbi:UNVERIFIED_CONTAM: hypothetical protein ABIC26_000140 [Paenibacillus sp. PvR008]